MSRVIKFRIWDNIKKEMYFPNMENDMFLLMGDSGYFDVQDHSNENYELNSNNLSIANSLDNDLVLMQSTGLKDKNGNEVYENDLIDANGTKVKIEFLESDFCFGFWHEKYQEWYTLSFLKGLKNFEILGYAHKTSNI